MTTVNEIIELEEQERHEFLGVGPRALTPFESARLAEDPCRPIYLDYVTTVRLETAYLRWFVQVINNPRAVPVTVSREFVRAGGSL